MQPESKSDGPYHNDPIVITLAFIGAFALLVGIGMLLPREWQGAWILLMFAGYVAWNASTYIHR
jgi:hypothetical protein